MRQASCSSSFRHCINEYNREEYRHQPGAYKPVCDRPALLSSPLHGDKTAMIGEAIVSATTSIGTAGISGVERQRCSLAAEPTGSRKAFLMTRAALPPPPTQHGFIPERRPAPK